MSAKDTLNIEVKQEPAGVVVTLVGSASMELCDRLSQSLAEACQLKPKLLVIEMSRLDFICSLGLGSLVVAYLRVQKSGGRLVLAAPSPAIRDMLAMTKLADLLPVYDSQSRALASP